MSDPYRYNGLSAGNIASIADSINSLVYTIGAKLQQAEEVQQYNSGVSSLRQGLASFQTNLKLNNDWESYDDLTTKTEDDLWEQIEKGTKNQAAKNKINEWWLQARDSNRNYVQQMKLSKRAEEMVAQLKKEDMQDMKAVALGMSAGLSSTLRDSRWKPLLDAGLISKDEWETRSQNYRASAEAMYRDFLLNTFEKNAMERAKAADPENPDWGVALKYLADPQNRRYVDEHTGDVYEATQDEIEKISRNIITAKEYYEYDTTQNNNRIEDKASSILDKMQFEGMTSDEASKPYYKLLSSFKGDDAGDLRYEWSSRWSAYISSSKKERVSEDPTLVALWERATKANFNDYEEMTSIKNAVIWCASDSANPPQKYADDSMGLPAGSLTSTDMRTLLSFVTDKTDDNKQIVLESLKVAFSPPADATPEERKALGAAMRQEYANYYTWDRDYRKENGGKAPPQEDVIKRAQAFEAVASGIQKQIATNKFYPKTAGTWWGKDEDREQFIRNMDLAASGYLDVVADSDITEDNKANVEAARETKTTMQNQALDVLVKDFKTKDGVGIYKTNDGRQPAQSVFLISGVAWRLGLDKTDNTVHWYWSVDQVENPEAKWNRAEPAATGNPPTNGVAEAKRALDSREKRGMPTPSTEYRSDKEKPKSTTGNVESDAMRFYRWLWAFPVEGKDAPAWRASLNQFGPPDKATADQIEWVYTHNEELLKQWPGK